MDEDVFDDNQLTEIEEYMKKLILSMFYVWPYYGLLESLLNKKNIKTNDYM